MHCLWFYSCSQVESLEQNVGSAQEVIVNPKSGSFTGLHSLRVRKGLTWTPNSSDPNLIKCWELLEPLESIKTRPHNLQDYRICVPQMVKATPDFVCKDS